MDYIWWKCTGQLRFVGIVDCSNKWLDTKKELSVLWTMVRSFFFFYFKQNEKKVIIIPRNLSKTTLFFNFSHLYKRLCFIEWFIFYMKRFSLFFSSLNFYGRRSFLFIFFLKKSHFFNIIKTLQFIRVCFFKIYAI